MQASGISLPFTLAMYTVLQQQRGPTYNRLSSPYSRSSRTLAPVLPSRHTKQSYRHGLAKFRCIPITSTQLAQPGLGGVEKVKSQTDSSQQRQWRLPAGRYGQPLNVSSQSFFAVKQETQTTLVMLRALYSTVPDYIFVLWNAYPQTRVWN